jgi:putative DNA methylase
MTEQRRKLIEVALPLEAINRESAREKSIRHGHPSTLHLWWARRPLAAARAVLFAQLVDDPSARPEEFPTQEAQDAERKRLFELIERLVVWENTTDEKLFAQAHAEILRSTDGNPPPILDPFAGGGSIPLEAQRLGLEAHASDLNPVAVLINKAMIEIPPKYAGCPPVFPGAADGAVQHWPRATGLAEDVRRYGAWMRDEAQQRIGYLYPKVKLADGSTANVIAWIWTRTVDCPNPACGIEMPLARSFWLSKKQELPTWLEPVVELDGVRFEIRTGQGGPVVDGTVGRAGATCVACETPFPLTYIRSFGQEKGLGQMLAAIVAEGNRRRIYLPAGADQIAAAEVGRPEGPETALAGKARVNVSLYGFDTHADLFSNRQLVALTTFSDLVGPARDRVAVDAKEAGLSSDDAEAYANAVALYLGFAVSRVTDRNNTICTWDSGPTGSRSSTGGSARTASVRNAFARQALAMTWDFAEANPFSESGGSIDSAMKWLLPAIERLPGGSPGFAIQGDAQSVQFSGWAVSTDPPYYDNISYADLSDFFYVWLRRSLGHLYSDVTATMLTPKAEELVATPYRFGGSKAKALEHFERGFVRTFTGIREKQAPGIPITVFYAFKQAESNEAGTSSTGWETMLNGLIEAGLMVTATWPMRTELSNRMLSSGTNALASSIVLACRPRPEHAEATTRRGFIAALKDDLPRALREMRQGSVAPVDLAQAAIGPGMAVFTNYSRVVEADGADMTVRTALALINQVLDETLSEQEGDFDADTRFCVKWFGQYAWDETDSGTADVLARATNTSIEGLQRGGVFRAVAGKARLLSPEDLSDSWDPLTDVRTSVWEVTLHLAKAVTERGSEVASALMGAAGQRVDLDAVKELAYLLYNICERKGWTTSALLFNGLGTSWSDLESTARSTVGRPTAVADTFSFDEEG